MQATEKTIWDLEEKIYLVGKREATLLCLQLYLFIILRWGVRRYFLLKGKPYSILPFNLTIVQYQQKLQYILPSTALLQVLYSLYSLFCRLNKSDYLTRLNVLRKFSGRPDREEIRKKRLFRNAGKNNKRESVEQRIEQNTILYSLYQAGCSIQ